MIFHQGNLTQSKVVGWLRDLRGHPHVPESNFDVTSVFRIRHETGTYHVGGVNVENAIWQVGTCGEEGAMAALTTIFGAGAVVDKVWVMGAQTGLTSGDTAPTPCGECRQRLAHFAAGTVTIERVSLDGQVKGRNIVQGLLPQGFGFGDLEFNGNNHGGGKLTPRLENAVREGVELQTNDVFAWMRSLQSDSRAKGIHEVAVLKLTSGAYVAGVRIENAAYPASTSAMQSAIAIACGQYKDPRVAKVAFFKAGADIKETAYTLPDPFTLQAVAEFMEHPKIPVVRFNQRGGHMETALNTLAPTIQTTWHNSR